VRNAILNSGSNVQGRIALVDRPADVDALAQVARRYAVAITPAMEDLIEPGAGLVDPIARQFRPDVRELTTRSDEEADPIGDGAHEVVRGLIHRYPDRVLLKLVQVCAVYCRFCFRRETVGPDQGAPMSGPEFDAALAYIAQQRVIWEVILSGGDPLVLSPRRIGEVTRALGRIGHVKVLRWHTRVPVVAPERVNEDLVAALKSQAQAVYVAVHANHPRELTPEARAACGRIIDAGIPMVSQTVLLKGVNDDPESLEALMRGFVETRIKPYYLHHLDRAPGTSHFRTSIAAGCGLMRDLRGRLSGLAQPTYVLDIPGGAGKVPIGPDYLAALPDEAGVTTYDVTDAGGCRHCYVDDAGTGAEPVACESDGDGTCE
jgi:lysine 2,3-aminomutase